MTHTKGKWISRAKEKNLAGRPTRFEVFSDDTVICDLHSQLGYKEEESNAQLIASAPELLESAIGLLLHSVPRTSVQQKWFDYMKDAIKKATS